MFMETYIPRVDWHQGCVESGEGRRDNVKFIKCSITSRLFTFETRGDCTTPWHLFEDLGDHPQSVLQAVAFETQLELGARAASLQGYFAQVTSQITLSAQD